MVKEMLAMRIIHPSTCPFSSSQKKKGGGGGDFALITGF